MKRWPVILLIALISAAGLVAQESPTDFTTTTSDISASHNVSLISKDPQLQRDDVIVGKKFKVTGLLVRPFKAIKLHKAGGGLLKLLQAINPFSGTKDSPEEARFDGELSTRAWASSVG